MLATRNFLRITQNLRAAMRRWTQSDQVRPMGNGLVVRVVSLVVEGDVNGHWKSLHLLLHCALHWLGHLESEERLVDSRRYLVHAALQVVEVFVESGVNDFIN